VKPFVEPSSDLRQWANFHRQMFVALTGEGFTEDQALTLVGEVLAAAIIGSDGS